MNKQELIEEIEDLKDLNQLFGNNPGYIKIDTVMGLVSKLDEQQKVQVPQFVADWYEEYKDNLEYNIWDWMKYNLEPKKRENVIFSRWLGKTANNPVETLVKMKLYGYTVEKEKRYLVKIIGITNYNSYLNYHKRENKWTIESCMEADAISTKHTRKELESAGFGWVFDCPGIEIEEVEG